LISFLKLFNASSVKAKGKLTNNENGKKMRCNPNKDIAQLIVNQRKENGR